MLMLLQIQTSKPRRRIDMFDLFVATSDHLSDIYRSEAIYAPWLVQAIWLFDTASKVFDNSYEYPRITIAEGYSYYSNLATGVNELINDHMDQALIAFNYLTDELADTIIEIRNTTSFSTLNGRDMLLRELRHFITNCTKGEGFVDYEDSVDVTYRDSMRGFHNKIVNLKERIANIRNNVGV